VNLTDFSLIAYHSLFSPEVEHLPNHSNEGHFCEVLPFSPYPYHYHDHFFQVITNSSSFFSPTFSADHSQLPSWACDSFHCSHFMKLYPWSQLMSQESWLFLVAVSHLPEVYSCCWPASPLSCQRSLADFLFFSFQEVISFFLTPEIIFSVKCQWWCSTSTHVIFSQILSLWYSNSDWWGNSHMILAISGVIYRFITRNLSLSGPCQ
jgi:hypothetical protein